MTDESLPELTDAVINSVTDERFDDADEAVAELQTEIERRQAADQQRAARSQASRESTQLSSDQRSALFEYERTRIVAETSRAGVLLAADTAVRDPVEGDLELLTESADEFVSHEQELADSAATADAVLDSIDVPPAPMLTAVSHDETAIPLGGSFTVDAVVENGGDHTTDSMTVRIETELEASPTEEQIGGVGDGTVSVPFEIDATHPGQYDLTMTLLNDGPVDSRTSTVEVFEKTALLEEAAGMLTQLVELVEAADLNDGRRRSLLAKLEAASSSLDRAWDALDSGDIERANNQLTTATNQLGALLNDLAAQGSEGNGNGPPDKTRLSARRRRSATTSAEDAIDQIVLARTAQLNNEP